MGHPARERDINVLLPILFAVGRRHAAAKAFDGKVVDAARNRAREFLRARSPFLWNATNLSRQLRKPLVELCADYHARVRVVYCETPFEKLIERNRTRAAAVPVEVVTQLLWRWEVPTVDECHERVLALQT